jgi:hypothetical protein
MKLELRIVEVKPKKNAFGKMLGFADINFSLDGSDDVQMAWNGFSVFQGDYGIWVKPPENRKLKKEGELFEHVKNEETGQPVWFPCIFIKRTKDQDNRGLSDELMAYITSEVSKAWGGKENHIPPKQKQQQRQASLDFGGDDDGIPF